MISATSNDNNIGVLSSTSDDVKKQITKGVIHAKLAKHRHLVLSSLISPTYLDELMKPIVSTTGGLFEPQVVNYNGGIGNVKEWKISCYLEVMEGGIPCTNPHAGLRNHCWDLLETCNILFATWYRQQHTCNNNGDNKKYSSTKQYKMDEIGLPIVSRLMTFITRYTPAPNENALLKHVDGAGKVDGSIVVALPIDRWTASHDINSFEGYGGGLTFWDGRRRMKSTIGSSSTSELDKIYYDTRSGDVAFIDNMVWHQANPIYKGTRWALVIFYKVHTHQQEG